MRGTSHCVRHFLVGGQIFVEDLPSFLNPVVLTFARLFAIVSIRALCAMAPLTAVYIPFPLMPSPTSS